LFGQEELVSQRSATTLLALLALLITVGGAQVTAQQTRNNEEIARRARSKVQPVYPELARKMNITGTVRIEIVVAPNGTVKDARVVGGHPLLADAALEAAKKWRFEPAPTEGSGVIDFKFEPR
jgi:TonB family protein